MLDGFGKSLGSSVERFAAHVRARVPCRNSKSAALAFQRGECTIRQIRFFRWRVEA